MDYGTLINKGKESISNNFDILCWNSPRCCPRSSPDGWIRFLFYKTCRKISQEDSVKKLGWLIYKWGRYLTFWTLEKRKEKRNIEVSKNFNFGNLKRVKVLTKAEK